MLALVSTPLPDAQTILLQTAALWHSLGTWTSTPNQSRHFEAADYQGSASACSPLTTNTARERPVQNQVFSLVRPFSASAAGGQISIGPLSIASLVPATNDRDGGVTFEKELCYSSSYYYHYKDLAYEVT